MARQRGQRQNFTFNKGWNTEASPLTFPENTASDLDNVVLDIDGSIRRRMGIACESPISTRYFQRIQSLYNRPAISFYKWENVAGSGDFNLLVSQLGTELQFNEEDGTDAGTIDFSDLIISGRSDEALKATIEVASGLGYLFVTAPFTEPFYVTYDVTTGTLSKTSFAIEIRDFEGADDGLAVDTRPSTLSNLHNYNLRNQGWPASYPCDSGSNPIQRTKDVLGGYPSNADVLYFGKTSTGTDEADIGKYSPTTMSKNLFGTSPAAKGKFILNAFDQDRSGVSGVGGTIRTTVNNRPRAVAFHNGRAFFAGINAVGYTGNVYYSQQLTTVAKVGKCYQSNDPTAEEFNELLATDGGLIVIPGCGNILRVQEGSAGIVVFASNGMWEITGENGKFSADNYFVRKVTDIGCISGDSVVNADGTFFYWSDAGIVGTQSDQVTGAISADVITKNSIQIGYLLFGGPQRRGSRGIWVRGEKKVVWLYSTDADYDGVDDRFKYNGVLVLDTNIGAFYKYSISDFNVGAAPYISGIVESSSTTTISGSETVTAGGIDVTADAIDVTAGVTAVDSDTVTSTWKLQVVRPVTVGTTSVYGIDFATFSSRTFTDWYFEDNAGANYNSYLETGFDYGGQAMFDKAPTYVYTYMSRVSKSAVTDGYYNIPDPTKFVLTLFTGPCVDANTLASYDSNVQTADAAVAGSSWKSPYMAADGSYLAISSRTATGSTGGIVFLDLATPYDIATATLRGSQVSLSETNGAAVMRWNSAGTKLYYGIDTPPFSIIYVYTAGIPFDFTELTYSTLFDVTATTHGDFNSFFIAGGFHFYQDFGNQTIYKYSGESLEDVDYSTASALQSLDLTTLASFGVSSSGDLRFNDDGTLMYLYDFTNGFYLFDLSIPYDLSTATFDQILSPGTWGAIGATQSGQIVDDETADGEYSLFTVSESAGSLYAIQGKFSCGECGDLGKFSDVDSATPTGGLTLGGVYVRTEEGNGDAIFTIDRSTATVYGYTMSTKHDLGTLSAATTFTPADASTGDNVMWHGSGFYLFIFSRTDNKLYRYTATTPYDLSTLVSTTADQTFDFDPWDSAVKGFCFNDSGGQRMYAVGDTTDTVYEFYVSGSNDIGSATFNDSYDFSAVLTNPAGIALSHDNTKMIILSDTPTAHDFTITPDTLGLPTLVGIANPTVTYTPTASWNDLQYMSDSFYMVNSYLYGVSSATIYQAKSCLWDG